MMCAMLFACGKTGALYLPEEPPEPAPAPQNEQVPGQDSENSGKTD